MTAQSCIAVCFPIPGSSGEGVWKLCARWWQLRWQQDHPALAVLCAHGGDNVSVLSSWAHLRHHLPFHTVLSPHSLHQWTWRVLQADVGVAAEHHQQQVTWGAVNAYRIWFLVQGIVHMVCASPLTVVRELGVPDSSMSCAGGVIYPAVRRSHFQRLLKTESYLSCKWDLWNFKEKLCLGEKRNILPVIFRVTGVFKVSLEGGPHLHLA